MTDISPRIDDDGVGWCSRAKCVCYHDSDMPQIDPPWCDLANVGILLDVCIPHVIRLAAENKRLHHKHPPCGLCRGTVRLTWRCDYCGEHWGNFADDMLD